MAPEKARHIMGNTILDLIKFLKNYEKAHGEVTMRADARELLSGRVLLSGWYPIEPFHELLRVLDLIVVHKDERCALELGAAGGNAMRGLHKTYIVAGDAISSVLAMRHAWRAHYDFGVITADASEGSVLYKVSGYPDMPMIHGLMTAGWGVSAARAAGVSGASAEIIDRPWLGSESLTYKVWC